MTYLKDGVIAVLVALLLAQGNSYKTGQIISVVDTVPPSCVSANGEVIVLKGSDPKLYLCKNDVPTQLGFFSGGVPSGSILLIDSGTCPTGFTQSTALNGKTLFGTIAANGDVGGTGGSDTITPAGTNGAITFTGTSANTSAITAGTPAGTNAASATSGNCAATNIAAGTGSTTACKATAPNLTVSAQTFTGTQLGTHQHTVTATGTINTPSFTGTQFDNRSAFMKVIFCKKD